jgi:Flagellar hook capping protein
MATSSILGQYEASLNQQAGTDRVATDKDTFLKLLVAQLTHQDPLNPVEDKEFIAQLAQFTSVEELQKLNTGMEQLNASYLASQVTSAASLIGLDVIAGGYNIYLKDADQFTSEEDYPFILMTPPRDMAEGTLTIYATDASGNPSSIVYSATLGSYSGGGLHKIAWPGTNSAGQPMPNGSYSVSISGKDADGKDMMVDISSNGIVIGVETSPDGNHKLYLNDGRTVNFNEIDLITVPAQSNTGTGGDDDGKDGDGDGKDGDGDGKGGGGTGTDDAGSSGTETP